MACYSEQISEPFVLAAASGTVKRVFTPLNSGYGNGGEIDHGNGYTTIYAHCKDAFYFSVGEHISRGENLCIMGNTGFSDGSHLHFEYRLNGVTKPVIFFEADEFIPGECYTSNNYPPNYNYEYSKACSSVSGPDSNWNYTCNDEKYKYDPWNNITILSKFTNLKTDHRFKIESYRNGFYLWEYITDWNYVGSGWDHSYFFPTLYSAMPGNWEFNISIDDGSGFVTVETVEVSVPADKYYTYNWGYMCVYVDGPDSYWNYSCWYPSTYRWYKYGVNAYPLVKISNIYADFRFSVYAYKNGVYQWEYTTLWNEVGGWGGSYAYFSPVIYKPDKGIWKLYVYIEDGKNFDYLTTLTFQVY